MDIHPHSIDIAIGFSSHDFGDCLVPNTRTKIATGSYIENADTLNGTFVVQYDNDRESLALFIPNATPENIINAITQAGLSLNRVINHVNTYITGNYQFT